MLSLYIELFDFTSVSKNLYFFPALIEKVSEKLLFLSKFANALSI